jgi:hypothetical protein
MCVFNSVYVIYDMERLVSDILSINTPKGLFRPLQKRLKKLKAYFELCDQTILHYLNYLTLNCFLLLTEVAAAYPGFS